MAFTIRPCLARDEDAWDRFVLAHPLGTPFHLHAWRRSIESVYGYAPRPLLAEDSTGIAAVLPLFLVSNPLTGKVLLSSPFAVYGGVLASSPEALAALSQAAVALARTENVQHAEFRNAFPEQCAGLPILDRYVTFTTPIAPAEDQILEAIPRKTRAMIRKALRFNYSSRVTRDPRPFFDLYSRNLRRLGTPCFPLRHFEALLHHCGPAAHIREILIDGQLAAAVFTLTFRDQLLPYYGASDPAFNAQAPNNFMYFEQMRQGARDGFTHFDFGRSKRNESGSYDFKAHWGMTERALPYEIALVRRAAMPNFSPANPRFRAAIRLWQHVPLPITRALGPWLVRLVP